MAEWLGKVFPVGVATPERAATGRRGWSGGGAEGGRRGGGGGRAGRGAGGPGQLGPPKAQPEAHFFFFDILRTQNPENRRGALQKIDILGRNTRFAPEAHPLTNMNMTIAELLAFDVAPADASLHIELSKDEHTQYSTLSSTRCR
ncbi:BQ5605_C012g06734 [Microbotryum silenes-dioicae]|uniref:BQ5605_C012g06734 protein n=1 Tax=Microbotryum silenes-dioicae TaxID=796604 RepID=A0A2X0LW08_9BASI|nr:BQ5605_C012g06734 [Microbotryum silenes-dioicae]